MTVYPSEIALPFRFESGAVAKVQTPEARIRQHVYSLISTSYGERVMRPDYGTSANNVLFDVNDPATQSILTTSLKDALALYEPNVRIDSLSANPTDDRAKVIVSLHYTYFVGRDAVPSVLDITSAFDRSNG